MHTNRLEKESSPYLRQHAHNPVDWYPWGAEALERARKEDKPIFLSVGYSTCHWCHVMERESFENEEVAEVLNRLFVPIKVDREERPDLDDIYMKATQLMTGHGGWPNSVWLTPDGRPFHAGTYFPPEDRGGRPGFRTVLETLDRFWHDRRDEIDSQAERIADSIRRMSGGGEDQRSTGGVRGLERGLVQRALEDLEDAHDRENGGFGGAPKFPPHGSLRLLLAELERAADATLEQMVTSTLDAMARGGIRDHIGGGFHRYSTDGRWFLPHFEKMLYDNAQLLRAYTDAHERWPDRGYDQVCHELCGWVQREMSHEKGGFYSALDADSEGEEGKFYVWRHREVMDVLGEEAGEEYCRAYAVIPEGNFHDEATGERHDTCIPFLPRDVDPARRPALQNASALLLEVRAKRVRPHLDDKVLTSWNGLMIGAMAHAGRVFERPEYIELAERAAGFLHSVSSDPAELHRSWRDGKTGGRGFLDDFAYLADGLLELHLSTGDVSHLERARALMDHVIADFHDERGGFFTTSNQHETLIARSASPYDEAIPSGNGVAARVLVSLFQRTGHEPYLERARTLLETYAGDMRRASRGTEALILASAEFLACQAARTATWGDAVAESEPLRVTAYLSQLSALPGGVVDCALQVVIAAGYQVAPEDMMLEIDGAEAVSSDDPLPADGAFVAETWWYRRLSVPELEDGNPCVIQIKITATPCTDATAAAPACLPERQLVVRIPFLIHPDASGEIRYPEVFTP